MKELLTGMGLIGSAFALLVNFGVALALALAVLTADWLTSKIPT